MRVCKICFGIFRDISETFEKFVNALIIIIYMFRDSFGIFSGISPRMFHPDPGDFGISGFLKKNPRDRDFKNPGDFGIGIPEKSHPKATSGPRG